MRKNATPALAQWCQQTAPARSSGTASAAPLYSAASKCTANPDGCSDSLPHRLQLQSTRRMPCQQMDGRQQGESHRQECAPGIMQSVQQPQQQQQPPQQRRQPCVAWRSEEEMRACSVELTRRDGYSRTFLQYLQSVETDVTKKKGSARREKTITRGAPRPRGRRAAAGGLAATRAGDLYRGRDRGAGRQQGL